MNNNQMYLLLKKRLRVSLSFSLFCVAFFSPLMSRSQFLSGDSLTSQFKQKVQKSGIRAEQLSILVTQYHRGKRVVLQSHRAQKLMIPASVTKVFTAATVLHEMDVGHQFMTRIYGKSPNSQGVLKGNLYLKGGGDPSFVSEKMWFLVNRFLRAGVKEIEGDIIVDDSIFDRDLYPGRSSVREQRAYDAPIGGMSFNWNSINIFVQPSDKWGRPLKIDLDPVTDYFELKNEAVYAKKGRCHYRRKAGKAKETMTVTGACKIQGEEKAIYRSITQPAIWSGHNLKAFLKNRGVSVSGTVKRGVTPQGARLLAENKSKPLSRIVADLMKFSNNYVAEMLTKQLAVQNGSSGSIEAGLAVIRRYISGLPKTTPGFTIKNSSGLTRENKVTSAMVVSALDSIRKRFDVFPEFLTSLPIAGVDGTLKNRMKGSEAQGWVRAKTGLLSGVVGLAGYAGGRNGEIYTFSFLYNGESSQDNDARKLFDALATELVR